MPELPDITAYLVALQLRIVGKRLEHVRLGTPFLLRTAVPPLADAEARTVPAATSSSTVGWFTGMTTCPSRFCAASP